MWVLILTACKIIHKICIYLCSAIYFLSTNLKPVSFHTSRFCSYSQKYFSNNVQPLACHRGSENVLLETLVFCFSAQPHVADFLNHCYVTTGSVGRGWSFIIILLWILWKHTGRPESGSMTGALPPDLAKREQRGWRCFS